MLAPDPTIDAIKNSITKYAFGDARFMADHGKPLGAFVLAFCLIDALAHHRYWGDASLPRVRDKYMKFVEVYLPSHDPQVLYDGARCRNVHNYSAATINGKPYSLEINDLLASIQRAMNIYFEELDNSEPIREIALKHAKQNPPWSQIT